MLLVLVATMVVAMILCLAHAKTRYVYGATERLGRVVHATVIEQASLVMFQVVGSGRLDAGRDLIG